jgi:hypothetical protein
MTHRNLISRLYVEHVKTVLAVGWLRCVCVCVCVCAVSRGAVVSHTLAGSGAPKLGRC